MFGLRWTEVLLIAGVLLLLFGARRLPALGAGIGGAIRGFKRGLSGETEGARPLPADDRKVR